MKVWLARWDRFTWVAAAEAIVLGLLLIVEPSALVRTLFGIPLLAHLGYTAMTALPVGAIPARPDGAKARRNPELRTSVIGFLNEVRRVEDYAQRARASGLPPEVLALNLQIAESRILAAAAAVAKAPGQGEDALKDLEGTRAGQSPMLTHAPTVHSA